MTSAMFRRDYDALKAEGVDLSPEDIIRLNALAVKAHVSADCALNVHVQRAAFLPRRHWWARRIMLREPTVAHWIWLEQVQESFVLDDVHSMYFVYAYAMSRPANDLPDSLNVDAVIRKVRRFMKRNLARLTDRQLFGAVDYCLLGNGWASSESAPVKTKPGEEFDAMGDGQKSPTLGIIAAARAYGIGLTTNDLSHVLPSEVEECVMLAQLRNGLIDSQSTRARSVAAYVRAREEIRARGKKENGQHD